MTRFIIFIFFLFILLNIGECYEKTLLTPEEIGYSETNVTFNSKIGVENTYNTKQNLVIYVPFPMENERQKVYLKVYMEISNSSYIYNTTNNCSCNNPDLCCEIIYKDKKFDTKRVKIKFRVPKGTYNVSYNIVENVKVNNTIPVTSLNFNSTLLQNFSDYLKYDELANYDENIKNFTENLTKDCKSDFEKVAKIVKWIYNNIAYNVSKIEIFQNASETFLSRNGICKHYTNLFLSMCRSINIPSRGIYGEIFNETSYISGHAWAEVFMDKWYPVDPTYGEIGIIDSGKIAFGSELSTSTFLYFDMDMTYLKLLEWEINPGKTEVINTTKFENIVNLNSSYAWINKTENNNIANGTLQITAEILRLNFPHNILGLISVLPPYMENTSINMTIDEHTKYFIIESDKNSTNVTFTINATNVNLSEGVNYVFPIIIHSLLSNISILNVTTFPIFIPNFDVQNDKDNYLINITVRNIGLRDGDTQVLLNFDGKEFKRELFVKGANNTNFTEFSFNNVKGIHTVEILVNNIKVKFNIGSCKGDVNNDGKVKLNDALELIGYVSDDREMVEEKKNCVDVNNDNNIDIFDVVEILEYLANE